MPIPIAAMSASLSMSDNGFSNVAKIATGSIAALGAAVTAAGIAITKLTLDQFPLIDRTAKLSEELDIATESLEAFKFASQLAGGSTLSLDKALQRLNRSVGEAKLGLSTPMRGFDALGIELRDLQHLNTEEIFLKIADAVSQMGNAQDRAVAVTALFGRAGAELTVLMKGGAQALLEAKKEAEELGLTFSKLDAKRVEEANDAVVRLKSSFRGFFNLLAIEFAPIITESAELLKNTFIDFRKNVLPDLVDKIKTVLPPLISGFAELAALTQTWWTVWKVFIKDVYNGLKGILKFYSFAMPEMSKALETIIDEYTKFMFNISTKEELKKNRDAWRAWSNDVIGKIMKVREKIDDVGKIEEFEAPEFKEVEFFNIGKIIQATALGQGKKEKPQDKIIDTTTQAIEAASSQALSITTKFLQGGGESVVAENAKANKETAEENKKQTALLNEQNAILSDDGAVIAEFN